MMTLGMDRGDWNWDLLDEGMAGADQIGVLGRVRAGLARVMHLDNEDTQVVTGQGDAYCPDIMGMVNEESDQ